jgi:hypothetical protein
MKACIYIHGLESTGNSRTAGILREEFAGVLNIIEPQIDYTDIQSDLTTVKTAIGAHSPCFLIGSSLGGFLAIQFPSCPKILINPALRPSEIGIIQQHPRLQPQLPMLKEMEKAFDVRIDRAIRANNSVEGCLAYGLFGTKDELFSYLDEFKRAIIRRENIWTCSDGHRLSEDTARTKLAALVKLLLQCCFTAKTESRGQRSAAASLTGKRT